MLRAIIAALFVAIALAGVNARAESGSRIDYRAPDGCPTAAEFEEAMRRRNASALDHFQAVSVAVNNDASGFSGNVTLRAGSGAVTHRQLSSDTCADVVEALAFAVAVAAFADARARETEPNRSSAPTPERAPPPEAVRPSPKPIDLAAGAQVGIATGLAPNVGGTVRAFADLASSSGGVLAPSARVSVAGFAAPAAQVGAARATFRELEGAVDVCPLRVGSRRMSVAPCGRLSIGALTATGAGIAAARSETRTWVAAAVLARGRFRASGAVALELDAGAVAPLIRDQFTFLPSTIVFSVPNLALSASLGAAVTIW